MKLVLEYDLSHNPPAGRVLGDMIELLTAMKRMAPAEESLQWMLNEGENYHVIAEGKDDDTDKLTGRFVVTRETFINTPMVKHKAVLTESMVALISAMNNREKK